MPHKKIIDLLIEAEAALRSSHITETPRLDAEVLLADMLGIDRSRLIASYTDWLGPDIIAKFQGRLERRLQAEPVSYITGKREFMGLSFLVDPRVLIPRAETETLVEYIIEVSRKKDIRRVLDIGTGSGCIAVSLAVFLPQAVLHATDTSANALEVAKRNAGRNGVLERIHFYEGRFYDPLPVSLKSSFDVIVSNPPYIPDDEYPLLQKNVREYEPSTALRGGPDGLCPFRQIVGEAPEWLSTGGTIAVEIGVGQANPASECLREAGLEIVETVCDLAGKQRIIAGRKQDG
jgi:release factor glutamine methyltransferase